MSPSPTLGFGDAGVLSIGDAGVFVDATSLTTFDDGKNLMQMQFGNVVAMQNASLSAELPRKQAQHLPRSVLLPTEHAPDATDSDVCPKLFLQLRRMGGSSAELAQQPQLLTGPLADGRLEEPVLESRWDVRVGDCPQGQLHGGRL